MDQEVKELILLAIVELKNGNVDEALLILERTVWPKWGTVEEADGAYRMFDPDAPKSEMHDFFAMALGHQVASAEANAKAIAAERPEPKEWR